jgi:hypothetical protein
MKLIQHNREKEDFYICRKKPKKELIANEGEEITLSSRDCQIRKEEGKIKIFQVEEIEP